MEIRLSKNVADRVKSNNPIVAEVVFLATKTMNLFGEDIVIEAQDTNTVAETCNCVGISYGMHWVDYMLSVNNSETLKVRMKEVI